MATETFSPEVVQFAERFLAHLRREHGLPDGWPRSHPTTYESDHAPAGGVTVGGKFFRGGEFIPGEVVAKATAAEKAAIRGEGGRAATTGGKANGGGGRGTAPAVHPDVRRRIERAQKRTWTKSVTAAGMVVDVARSRRVKAAHKRELELAEAIGGFNLPDSEPADVMHVPELAADGSRTGRPLKLTSREARKLLADRAKMVVRMNSPETPERDRELIRHLLEVRQPVTFFEVKTLLKRNESKVSISREALAKKERWEAKYHARFNLVVVDDRKGHKHSGHRVYVQPEGESLSKTHRLEHQRKVGSMADVLAAATGEA
jgi:hypothetical protein